MEMIYWSESIQFTHIRKGGPPPYIYIYKHIRCMFQRVTREIRVRGKGGDVNIPMINLTWNAENKYPCAVHVQLPSL